MLIGFDASRAFVPEATGTENYSLNLLRALARVDRVNQYRVYLREPIRLSVLGYQLSENGPPVFRSVSLRTEKQKTAKHGSENRKLRTNWPSNFEFKIVRPRRLWTQMSLALETWRSPVDLLFVPAHTLPFLGNLRVKTVVTMHDLGVEFLPQYHQFPQRYYLDLASKLAAKRADVLIAVSDATRYDLIQRYHIRSKKIYVVYEGVDLSFFKTQSSSKIERIKRKYKIKDDYILFVGTVQPRKNLQMLIAAFSLLAGDRFLGKGKEASMDVGQRSGVEKPNNLTQKLNRLPNLNPNLQLVIAGKLGWDWREILAAPKKLGVEDQVKFLGYVPSSDLPSLYSGAVVLAASSLFEGFDLPILEALACGCEVVASDIPAHREIYRNLKFKISNLKLFEPIVLVKPTDVDRWASILYQYILQYDKKHLDRRKSKLRAGDYSWEQTARMTLDIFEKVLQ